MKNMPGEKNNDEPFIDHELKYAVEVHYFILGKTIARMEKKISKNQILYTDFACLLPVNFEDINKKKCFFQYFNRANQQNQTI